MAITYVDSASWASAGAGTPNYNKSVTFSGAAAGDLLFVAGVAEDYDAGNPTARSVATTSGSTSAWTTSTVAPTDEACDLFGGWATVSSTGSVTVRVSLRCNNVNWMGVGGFLYPAAERDSGVTPAYTVLNAPGTNTNDGTTSVTLGAGETWSVFYFSGDWSAKTYGATSTPAGATSHVSQADVAHYSNAVRSWTGQSSGTRSYGVSTANRNAGIIILAVAEAGGAPALPPIFVQPPRR